MRKLILSALLLTSAVPSLAQVPPPDYDRRPGYDHREVRDDRGALRDDRHELQQDRRDGDRREFQGDRRDLRDDRRDLRDDRHWGDDRRGYGYGERDARFRGESFYYPRGFGYRYYGPGVRIPRAYFDSRYYIARPEFYRLPPAYGGTRWIRIGPDALLIRAYDGRVIRVIRGLFY